MLARPEVARSPPLLYARCPLRPLPANRLLCRALCVVEGPPGRKLLIHVQKTFERFSVGKPGDRSMNQATFQAFCEEMGMVNPEMTKRLFLAMDDDNTGAMEATEFLNGLRMMCDDSGGGEAWKEKRVEFAFNLFDLDREKSKVTSNLSLLVMDGCVVRDCL